MFRNQQVRFFAIFVITMLIMAVVLGVYGKASAVMIEPPTRTVVHLEVTYAEWIPTDATPNRFYFELNDGSVWGYRDHGVCKRADKLPNRICNTVFWYAR